MELARAAQREALRDLEPPVKRRAPSLPGLPDFEHIPHRSEWWDHRDPAFGELFGKLCRCVRQAILLEARIAAGTLDRPAAPAPTPGPADRAGPAHQPTRPRPAEDRSSLTPERLEDDLASGMSRPVADILEDISQELGRAAQPQGHRATPRPLVPAPAPVPAPSPKRSPNPAPRRPLPRPG